MLKIPSICIPKYPFDKQNGEIVELYKDFMFYIIVESTYFYKLKNSQIQIADMKMH